MKRSMALRADDIFSGVMLPLVSSRMPRLTGTRSLLNCAISCCSPSSNTLKSSLVRPETKCPLSSLTVAVTFTSSTPLLKRNASPPCDWAVPCDWAASDVTAAAMTAARAAKRRRMERMTLPHSLGELNLVRPPVDVPHHRVAAAERHAIARDIRDVRHGDDERRFVARRQRAEVQRRAAARLERAVAVEREDDGGHAVHRRAARGILHQARHRERGALT